MRAFRFYGAAVVAYALAGAVYPGGDVRELIAIILAGIGGACIGYYAGTDQ